MKYIVVLYLLSGCTFFYGSRRVAPPASENGYARADLREVSATAPSEINVQVEARVGDLAAIEQCGGLIAASLLLDEPNVKSTSTRDSGIILVVPRSHYRDVKNFYTMDRVRARGYLSHWLAPGCSMRIIGAQRALWVDSLERVDVAATASDVASRI